MIPVEQTETEKYDAFISYSRKDIEFASRLEKALENYKPPSGLNLPQRYLRIFRDVSDMTGADYEESIQDKIQKSTKLIVICSPAARQSPRKYVDDEILRFARAKGAGSIIPLIVAGIPNDEAKPEQAAEMAFPEALCELKKTLSADYRGFDPRKDKINKGNFSNSWSKLLAELFNLSRGEIEQRDLKRKLRRRNIIATISFSLFLIFAGIAAYAWMQKVVAETRGKIALSRQLVAQSLTLLNKQYDLALLLNLEGNRVIKDIATKGSFWVRWFNKTFILSQEGVESMEARSGLLECLTQKPTRLAFFDFVERFCFSPDGHTLALLTNKDEKTEIVFWDVQKSQAVASPLHDPEHRFFDICLSRDGKTLVTASTKIKEKDTYLISWDVTTYQKKSQIHYRKLIHVAFSPDGCNLALVEERRIILFNLNNLGGLGDQEALASLKCPSPIEKVYISDDGRTLSAVLKDGILVWWDITNPQEPKRSLVKAKRNALGSSGLSIVLSANGKTLAFTDNKDANYFIILWDLIQNKEICKIRISGNRYYGNHLAFSSDGQTIAMGNDGFSDILLWVWNVKGEPLTNPTQEVSLNGHIPGVFEMRFCPSNPILAASYPEGNMILWDLSGHPPLVESLKTFEVQTAAYNPMGGTLALVGEDRLELWTVDEHSRPIAKQREIPVEAKQVVFSQNGKLLAAIDDEKIITIWDLTRDQDQQPIQTLNFKPFHTYVQEVELAWQENDRLIAAVNWSKRKRKSDYEEEEKFLSLWDVRARQPLGEKPLQCPKEELTCMAFSPDARMLASGHIEGSIYLWDVSTSKTIKNINLKRPGSDHGERINTLSFRKDGRVLVSCDTGGMVVFWDPIERKRLGPDLNYHKEAILSLAIDPSGLTLASTSEKYSFLWDVASRRPLGQLPTYLFEHDPWNRTVRYSLAFGSRGKKLLLTYNQENRQILWDVDVESWKVRARRIANRDLKADERKAYLGEQETLTQVLHGWLIEHGILTRKPQ